MSLINIDSKDAEIKLSIVRRYFPEIAYLALAACIIFLFTGQRSIEKDMRQYLMIDRVQGIGTITENTNVIRENTEVMKEVRDLIKQKNQQIKD